MVRKSPDNTPCLAAMTNPETIPLAGEIVRPGGTIGWVGAEVLLHPPPLPWDLMLLKNVTLQGGAAPVRRHLRRLWPLVESGRADPSPVITHDLPLAQGAEGYDVMNSRMIGSVKVALTP